MLLGAPNGAPMGNVKPETTSLAPLKDEEFLAAAEDAEEADKLAAERQARRDVLREFRQRIANLPYDELFELPARPNVVMEVKDYSKPDASIGRATARTDVPFLFKAFEQGQTPPPRPGSKKANTQAPRAFTIHEYLDWTVTATEPAGPDCLDFSGFRVVVLNPRYIRQWPPPNMDDTGPPPKHPTIGAPKPAIPRLAVHNKPICAATIRLGPSWMEIPFYATQEGKRNRGYGRALLEGLEDLCRYLHIPRILLCSTDDQRVKGTWQRLGLSFTTGEDLDKWGVTPHDLLHMDNTVQMHKEVGPKNQLKTVLLKHGDYQQRCYYMPGSAKVPLKLKRGTSNGALAAKKPAKKPATKPSARKRHRF